MKSKFIGGVSGSALDQWFDPTKETALLQKNKLVPFFLEPAHRKTAIGIAQLVMLSELAVNQALDHVEVKT